MQPDNKLIQYKMAKKNLLNYFLVSIITAIMVNCSDEKDYTSHFHNYIQLSVMGNSSLHEDDVLPIKIKLLLANTLKEDATITLELKDNKDEILYLKHADIDIKAGSKEAMIEIFSNQKNILEQQQVVTLRVKSYSDQNMQPWNEATIIVKPKSGIPELTEEQRSLISGYKEKLDLDLNHFLGKLSCKTIVSFNSGDLGILYDSEDVQTYEGTSIVTLSEYATAERPILKIVSNPLGMNSFLWDIMKRCTVENETWNDEYNPEPLDILKAINYQESQETFETILDGIELFPTEGKVTFLKSVMVSPGNEGLGIAPTLLMVVPFQYKFSAWERFKELSEKNVTYLTKEGDMEIEKLLKDAPESYQINPTYHLTYSNLDTDEWGDETGFLTPEATYNINNGTLCFTFSWDCQISSGGYTQIRCIYSLKEHTPVN